MNPFIKLLLFPLRCLICVLAVFGSRTRAFLPFSTSRVLPRRPPSFSHHNLARSLLLPHFSPFLIYYQTSISSVTSSSCLPKLPKAPTKHLTRNPPSRLKLLFSHSISVKDRLFSLRRLLYPEVCALPCLGSLGDMGAEFLNHISDLPCSFLPNIYVAYANEYHRWLH